MLAIRASNHSQCVMRWMRNRTNNCSNLFSKIWTIYFYCMRFGPWARKDPKWDSSKWKFKHRIMKESAKLLKLIETFFHHFVLLFFSDFRFLFISDVISCWLWKKTMKILVKQNIDFESIAREKWPCDVSLITDFRCVLQCDNVECCTLSGRWRESKTYEKYSFKPSWITLRKPFNNFYSRTLAEKMYGCWFRNF